MPPNVQQPVQALRQSAPTILVAEGDVLIRAALAQYLRACGYRVLEASSGDEATALLSDPGTGIDVLLARANLPGSMGGFALSRWVRRAHPTVKVILTGGVRRAAWAAGELCDQGPHARRPYEPQELERRIRALLAGDA